MPTKRPAQLKFISEKLADLYEETVTEPLPERWMDLIHQLNEREQRGENDVKGEGNTRPN